MTGAFSRNNDMFSLHSFPEDGKTHQGQSLKKLLQILW